ncbi:MAG: hypothetical protein JW934_07940 [Anaerolineae bacterium]|nr:hypothetical protein [Anaerolineae bacterium]
MRAQFSKIAIALGMLAIFLFAVGILLGHSPLPTAAISSTKLEGKQTTLQIAQSITWTVEMVDHTSGTYRDIAISADSSNKPRIVYLDTHETGGIPYSDLVYARLNGDTWITQTITPTGCYDHPLSGLSMSLDSSGYPHIAYHYFTPSYWPYVGGHLNYIAYDGSQWNEQNIDQGQQKIAVGAYPSLALDSNGLPHIGYSRQDYIGDSDSVLYAYFANSTWTTQIVESSNNTGWYVSLTLDTADRPHISYYDGAFNALKYAWYDGTIWHKEVVTNTYVNDIALALDTSNRPHIVFDTQHFNDYKLVYAWHNGTNWQFEIVSNERALGVSMVLDSQDKPHIGYSASEIMKYAYKDQDSWEIELIDDSEIDRYLALAVDKSDNLHLGYSTCFSTECLKTVKYAYIDVSPNIQVYLPLVLRNVSSP